MKNLYLVETTTDKRWEIHTGFHLVFGENAADAMRIAKLEKPDENVIDVRNVEHIMIGIEFETIINSEEE